MYVSYILYFVIFFSFFSLFMLVTFYKIIHLLELKRKKLVLYHTQFEKHCFNALSCLIKCYLPRLLEQTSPPFPNMEGSR